jgi:hypothetical protein
MISLQQLIALLIVPVLIFAQSSKYQNIVPRHRAHELTELEDLKYQQVILTLPVSDESRVVSFTLYGNDKKYTLGAIRNAIIAPRYYPGWKIRFYGKSSKSCNAVRV